MHFAIFFTLSLSRPFLSETATLVFDTKQAMQGTS